MLIPSRLPEFRSLFSRFVDDFLEAEIGAQHRQLLLQASAAAKASYDRISEKAELESDYTDDLLRSFIPHGDSTYVREEGAWLHFAPTVMGPIQKKFEGSGWTKKTDWPKVATAIFELVRTGVEEPENFAEACRTFSELPWTKGLQAAYLSPILASLRPDLYSVANTKPLKVGAWLFGEAFDHSSSIARYPAFNRDLRSGIDELAEIIDPHVPDDLDRYQTFDFFTHWMVSIDKWFEKSGKTDEVAGRGDTTNTDPRNFWWLNCTPDEMERMSVGAEQTYRVFDEGGKRKRIYSNIKALRVGDLLVAYEPTPYRRISAILEITRPLTAVGGNEEFRFRMVAEMPDPVPLAALRECDALSDSEPIAYNQAKASLFALTPDEFQAIAELGNIDPEAIEVGVAEDEKREEIRRLIDETRRDPRARESFEAREKSEAQARALLEEKVGSMTEEGIRYLLDRLTLARVDENGRDISARFGVALIGHSANQIAGDPEAFNHWTELLWKSEPEEAIEHLGTMVRQKKVKGGGISLASAILYLRDPEQFGIGLGMMTRYLRDFGYDPPTKLVTAEEYRSYLKELHRFRDEFGVDATHLDYVIWDVGAKLDRMTVEETVENGDSPKPSITSIAEETNIDESILTSWIDAIERKGQAILYGPPGTGKTFVARKLARYLADLADGIVQTIQFHPAYGYEDFIAGIRPVTDEETNELRYVNTPGAFVRFCDEARTKGEESRCVMIIDEINRADLARVFGELMYLLEYRDKEIRLAGGATFSIPENVRIIGTMNTADRSIALVDHALRRRFAFLELRPDYDLLVRYHERVGSRFDPGPLVDLLKRVNDAIGDPHYAVGISYFLDRQVASVLPQIWQTEIEPYLAEHFFDRPEMVEEFRWGVVGGRLVG